MTCSAADEVIVSSRAVMENNCLCLWSSLSELNCIQLQPNGRNKCQQRTLLKNHR